MGDPHDIDSNANPPDGEGAAPDGAELAPAGSPGIAPDDHDTAPVDAVKTGAGETGAVATSTVEPKAVKTGPVVPRIDPIHHSGSIEPPPDATPGTALVLAAPQVKAGSADQEAAAGQSAPGPKPLFRFRTLAAIVAVAAVLGGLAGSLATAGITYWAVPQSTTPTYYAAFSEALGRVDHELTALKASIDTSTKASSLQVGKITERIDRVEKAQADAGTKLAKAADPLDRVERRLGAPNDVTGSIPDSHAVASATTEPRRAALAPGPASLSLPIVDGWVLRDVYNGAAMIQSRAGVIEVLPGDNLPGLGRIESVRRQDGRWVVVTSRGLIVPR